MTARIRTRQMAAIRGEAEVSLARRIGPSCLESIVLVSNVFVAADDLNRDLTRRATGNANCNQNETRVAPEFSWRPLGVRCATTQVPLCCECEDTLTSRIEVAGCCQKTVS